MDWVPALFVGIGIGYFAWGPQPEYISLILESEASGYGETIALHKSGSGQVALFHGFIDDYHVCQIAQVAIEANGGSYLCLPVKG